jgi:hypothetical protein
MEQEELDTIIEAAQEARGDLLADLAALQRLAAQRRRDPVLEARYERLRARVKDALNEQGPRIYLDEDGNKQLAYPVNPTTVSADVEELVALVKAGRLPGVDLDKVFPRTVDTEELRKVIASKKIPTAVVAKHVHLRPLNAGHVGFKSLEEEDR